MKKLFLSFLRMLPRLPLAAANKYDNPDTIVVSRDGTGEFRTIDEAIEVCRAFMDYSKVIYVKKGVYKEKLILPSWLTNITICGEDRDNTIITWDDHANIKMPVGGLDSEAAVKGKPMGTFRTYTLKVQGSYITLKNITIENNAAKLGQAVSLHLEGDHILVQNCRLLGNQDTLFCAPLPEKEREKDGFLGPRGLAPRRASAQYYHACEIAGDIDFIFGGADALFEHCTLRTVDNGLAHSWVTAPSGAADGLGFVFWDCDFVSDCPAGSVYLGRPWRPTGKTAVLDCRLGAHIAPEGFAGWNVRTDTALDGFAEAGSTGAGAGERPGWVQALSAAEAAALLRTARQKCRMETTEGITE